METPKDNTRKSPGCVDPILSCLIRIAATLVKVTVTNLACTFFLPDVHVLQLPALSQVLA